MFTRSFFDSFVLLLFFFFFFFFFNDTATTEIYTLSLHDALPIPTTVLTCCGRWPRPPAAPSRPAPVARHRDRKSTRLNSSHANISYAVFCLKKKKKHQKESNELNIMTPKKSTIK